MDLKAKAKPISNFRERERKRERDRERGMERGRESSKKWKRVTEESKRLPFLLGFISQPCRPELLVLNLSTLCPGTLKLKESVCHER
jgi:hypothetical protein